MTGTPTSKKTLWPVTRRILRRALLILVGTTLLLILAVQLLLKTPYVTDSVSDVVSRQLGTSVGISSLRLSGTGITLADIRIMNPAGHPRQPMVTIRSLTVAPRWSSILRGQRRFTTIAITAPVIALQRNSTGEWNISPVIAKLGKQKSSQETIIDRLLIRDASLTTPVTKLAPLALDVRNLATKGSADSSFIVDFQDLAGNPYRIEGKAALTAPPSVTVLLTSDRCTAAGFSSAGHQLPPLLAATTARLRLAATLAKGQIASDLQVHLSIPRQDKGWPGNDLEAEITAAGTFLPEQGTATVKRIGVTVGKEFTVNGSADLALTSNDKRFTLRLAPGALRLQDVAKLAAPHTGQQKFSVSGTVRWSDLVLSGNQRSGVTSCTGTITLREGSLSAGKRQILSELTSAGRLQKHEQFVTLVGSLTHKGESSLFSTMDVPFVIRFSPRLAFMSAQIPAMSLTAGGIPITGDLLWQMGPTPIFKAAIRTAPFSLNRAAQRFGVPGRFDRGNASLQLAAVGKTPRDSQGTLAVKFSGITGEINDMPMEGVTAALDARFSIDGQPPRLAGTLKILSGSIKRNDLSASLPFTLSPTSAEINNASAVIGDVHATLRQLSAQRDMRTGSPGDSTLWAIDINGLALKWREFSANNIQAPLTITLKKTDSGASSVVTGTVRTTEITHQDKLIGSLGTRFSLSGFGLSLTTSGTLFGGKLNTSITSAPGGKAPFAVTAAANQMDVAMLSQLLSATAPVLPSGGKADFSASGTAYPDKRTTLSLQATLNDGALRKNSGKTIVTGIHAAIATRFAGDTLTIASLSFATPQGPKITGNGIIRNVTGQARSGDVHFSLPIVPISSMLDTVANGLPTALQEATATGSVTGEMNLRIKGRPSRIDGKLTIADGGLEIASQKLTVSGIHGSIPLVADLTAAAFKKKQADIPFSRDNHGQLVENLRTPRTGNDQLTIESISIGPLVAKSTRILFSPTPDALLIPWLRTNIYDGAIIGQGFVSTAGGLQYGADLLLDELSLKAFSNSYPSLQGYIQGLVDGIISLHGKGASINGLTGLVRLWAKEGKDEPMLVSKEFLQKVAGKKLRGFLFRNDRNYDRGEIGAAIEKGYITFQTLDLSHTNMFGVRDISISVAPIQNRIALDHLLSSIRQAAQRGKAATSPATEEAPPAEFKWEQ